MDATAAADVQGLAGVFFEVRAFEPDARVVDLDPAVDGDRIVVLRDLVVLRHVGIEVVLAREDRSRWHVEVHGLGEAQDELDRLGVQHRQRTGKAETHRTDVRVGLGAELVRAAAEHLRRGRELHVHLEADHCLVRSLLRRSGGRSLAGECLRLSGPAIRAHARRPEHHVLTERRRQHLHADGQPALAGSVGNGHSGVAGEVRGDGADVGEVHRERIGRLRAELERNRGRRGRQQHVEVLVRAREVADDQRAHALRLAVVRVVVAGRRARTCRA